MVSIHPSSDVGRVVGGRYRLLAPLGRGASAQVHLADDLVLGRRVAVKLLPDELAKDPAFVAQFHAEARTLATLHHPNIVVVRDREVEDAPYLVTEYLAGGSLRGMLAAGRRLSPSQALVVGLDACRGLAHAHAKGVVHRDLKPANLLFDAEGGLQIADFGIARVLAARSATEPEGGSASLIGTLRYASPEQADGAVAGPKSDVYALALVLIEAVTGVLPFAGPDPVAMLRARTLDDLEVPEELGPLRSALARAGRLDPAERADAEEFGIALLAASERLPAPEPLPMVGAGAEVELEVDDSPTLVHVPDPAPTRRRRWPVVAVGAVVAALIAAAAVLAFGLADPAEREAVPELVGRTVEDVALLAESAGWEIDERSVRRNGTEPGEIVDTDPPPGTELAAGEVLVLFVSLGNELTDRPSDLVGRPVADVLVDLERAGLVGTVEEVHHEEVPAGDVIGTDGEVDARPPRGTEIPLLVSSGPAPRTVPAYGDDAVYDAMAALLVDMGLVPVRVDEFDDDVPRDVLLALEPPPGTEVPRDSEVRVIVSKGPDVVEVPDLTGMSLSAAENALNAAGLVLGQQCCDSRGTVAGSDPPTGAVVRRGSEVNLFLVR